MGRSLTEKFRRRTRIYCPANKLAENNHEFTLYEITFMFVVARGNDHVISILRKYIETIFSAQNRSAIKHRSPRQTNVSRKFSSRLLCLKESCILITLFNSLHYSIYTLLISYKLE